MEEILKDMRLKLSSKDFSMGQKWRIHAFLDWYEQGCPKTSPINKNKKALYEKLNELNR